MEDLEARLAPKAYARWAQEKAYMQMVAEEGSGV